METFENKKRYEWTTGTRNGKVETYIAEDETNVYFESGRFVPKEQFDYQLRQIEEIIFQQKYILQLDKLHQQFFYKYLLLNHFDQIFFQI